MYKTWQKILPILSHSVVFSDNFDSLELSEVPSEGAATATASTGAASGGVASEDLLDPVSSEVMQGKTNKSRANKFVGK
jgi:hypothetical protein